ncbi:MAG: methyltransferase domain-containing protein [Patescibacteria group bacterium]|nr:methyltransferase domain-containing protein [Patescibacteria group bacterium]
MLHRAVFVPSTDDKLKIMLKLAKPRKKDKIIDLGCGDGKIIFALAKQGFNVVGVEINPFLVKKCQKKAKELKLEKSVTIVNNSFWNLNLSKYDLVFLYGTAYIMERLEKKLQKELKPGSRIISNYFQFPQWSVEKKENEVRVYEVTPATLRSEI